MSARDRAKKLELGAAAAEKRIAKREEQYKNTVSQVSKLLGDALPKRVDIATAGATTQDKTSHAFNVGLQLDRLEGKDEQMAAVGPVRVESFLVRVTAWLPEVDPSVPTDRILRVTKLLASLACVSVLEAVGSRTATTSAAAAASSSSDSGVWKRSDIHTLTATDVLEYGSTLYTEMGFQFSMRLSGDEKTPNRKVFRKLTTNTADNRAVEVLMVEVLQGMLTALGQMKWRFAGRKTIPAEAEFANVVRNEVRIRNDGAWKFADRLGDGADDDNGKDAPDQLVFTEAQKRKAEAATKKAAKEAAARACADAESDLRTLPPLRADGPGGGGGAGGGGGGGGGGGEAGPSNPLEPNDNDVFL